MENLQSTHQARDYPDFQNYPSRVYEACKISKSKGHMELNLSMNLIHSYIEVMILHVYRPMGIFLLDTWVDKPGILKVLLP